MSYDFIVCGAGSAGTVLACRLTEDPACTVLLLEAGTDFPDPDARPDELRFARVNGPDIMASPHNWQSVATTTGARLVPVARGKVTGGSSSISGPTVLRGLPEDYDSWAARGNDRWSFARVLPFLRRLETDTDFGGEYHGTEGPLTISRFRPESWLPTQMAFYEACRAAGFPDSPDLNHPDAIGIGPTPMSTLDHRRWSTAVGYLASSRTRRNLTIRPATHVQRVMLAGDRAYGVEIKTDAGVEIVSGGQIVLSCGAVGSPLVLTASGCGPWELPGVGRGLTDHPTVSVPLRAADGVALDGEAPLRQLTLRYTASGSADRNDMKINMESYTPLGPGRPPVMSLRASVSLSASRGRVDVRPGAEPSISLDYLADHDDRRRLREAVRLCAALAAGDGLGTLVAERLSPTDAELDDDDALDRWLRRSVFPGQHWAGTCRMGPSTDPMAVLDQYGRVHGIRDLRVVDASVMPTPVRANTNLTTMMIGERMAELVRD